MIPGMGCIQAWSCHPASLLSVGVEPRARWDLMGPDGCFFPGSKVQKEMKGPHPVDWYLFYGYGDWLFFRF